MTTLQAHSPYWQSMLWLRLVGIGSGMFNSPNTAAMMGTVPTNRRGIAAGARMMLQNTGAVISIAFVLAIITAAVPKSVLFKIFSGLASGLSEAQLEPFINNMHAALWVLAATSLFGAGVSTAAATLSSPPAAISRPLTAPVAVEEAILEEVEATSMSADRAGCGAADRRRRQAGWHHAAHDPLLRGDRPAAVAQRARAPRPPHLRRGATSSGLTEMLRLKDLLGVSLEELKELVEAEDAREALRREWQSGVEDPVRRRQILEESLGHIGRQLELARRRRDQIARLESELLARRKRCRHGFASSVARRRPAEQLNERAPQPRPSQSPAAGLDSATVAVANLLVSFGQLRAVDGISFSVGRGEVFGLLGPNGAGKTTTLRVLTTLFARRWPRRRSPVTTLAENRFRSAPRSDTCHRPSPPTGRSPHARTSSSTPGSPGYRASERSARIEEVAPRWRSRG